MARIIENSNRITSPLLLSWDHKWLLCGAVPKSLGVHIFWACQFSSTHIAYSGAQNYPLVPTTVAVPGRPKQRFTLLPPPADRGNPLAAVDLGKVAEVSAAGHTK
jgi:hypothetical protein